MNLPNLKEAKKRDEKEVLYERKSGFKVLSKKKVDGVWYILLREV